MAEEDLDPVKIGMAFLGFVLEKAPHLIDAFAGGNRTELEAWARQREESIRERVEFERLRGEEN